MNDQGSRVEPDDDTDILKERVVELERKILQLLSAPQPEHVDTSSSRWGGQLASVMHEITSDEPDPTPTIVTADLMGRHNTVWQLALADPHTGLANKLLLLDRLEHALIRSARHGGYVIVIYFDLINLNHLCDDFGYNFGLEILVQLAQRLTSSLRDEDSIGRVAGTELVAVVSLDSETSIGPIAQRLESSFKQPFIIGGQRVHLSAQLGIVVAQNNESGEEVLGRARGATKAREPAPRG
jgi:diguanylate cyclase (GGDEF)-like protein